MPFVSLLNPNPCSPIYFYRDSSYEGSLQQEGNTSLGVQEVSLDLVAVFGVHVTLLLFLAIQVDSGRCLFLQPESSFQPANSLCSPVKCDTHINVLKLRKVRNGNCAIFFACSGPPCVNGDAQHQHSLSLPSQWSGIHPYRTPVHWTVATSVTSIFSQSQEHGCDGAEWWMERLW